MKILVCGSRGWNDMVMMHEVIASYNPTSIVHGGARGADLKAAVVAVYLKVPVVMYPAEWEKYGKAAGPLRNQKMLSENPDLVLAFWDGTSNGTRDMMTRASKQGVKVMVYQTNGNNYQYMSKVKVEKTPKVRKPRELALPGFSQVSPFRK